MSEWQPIETAPRDWTCVDLWVVEQYVRQADRNTGERIPGARWQEPSLYGDRRKHEECWCVWSSPYWEPIEREIPGGSRFVTHWMPPPEPPR